MTDDSPLFILAGNGPYDNRGCEAIVRGTTKILRAIFPEPRFVCVSQFLNTDHLKRQRLQEADDGITHLSAQGLSKRAVLRSFWKPSLWHDVLRYYRNPCPSTTAFRDMIPCLESASAILSVGGDNYSLDYGVPDLFTRLDDLVLAEKKPLVIWGASVGPFSAIPDYERYMGNHLSKVTGIFARESASVEYLRTIGVTENVHSVADPAFLLDPIKPPEIEEMMPIEKGGIGLNLSPLMAKFVTGGDLKAWTNIAASIISEVAQNTDVPVYLIPHVTTPDTDDYSFMMNALSQVRSKKGKISVIPPVYGAAETKWLISRLDLFAGARTHATIASLSSGVPTLSFAYSVKAIGINADIFGHASFCLSPEKISPKIVVNQIERMLSTGDEISDILRNRIPDMEAKAIRGGEYLANLLNNDNANPPR